MEVRIGNGIRKKHGILEKRKGRCKLVDGDKFARNELALEHTSMKAQSVRSGTSLTTRNGFHDFNIIMEDLSVQL